MGHESQILMRKVSINKQYAEVHQFRIRYQQFIQVLIIEFLFAYKLKQGNI